MTDFTTDFAPLDEPGDESVDLDAPLLIVTIEPLRYFVEAIACGHFRVVSMVPQGSSPETYDPVPQQLVWLSRSQAYLMVGHIGFERSWCDRLAENAPGLRFFDTSKGIDYIYGAEHSHGLAHRRVEVQTFTCESSDSVASDENGQNGPKNDPDLTIEPHVWNSPVNARIIARNVCRALSEIDDVHANNYHMRLDSLLEIIDRTDSVVRSILSRPGVDDAFLIYHPALSYFAREYGLKQFAIEADGKEPSPAHLAQLIEKCRLQGVRTVFVQPEFDQRNAELIARQTGSHIVSINPLAYDWAGELIRIAQALAHDNDEP